jgi:hypothetical protein
VAAASGGRRIWKLKGQATNATEAVSSKAKSSKAKIYMKKLVHQTRQEVGRGKEAIVDMQEA